MNPLSSLFFNKNKILAVAFKQVYFYRIKSNYKQNSTVNKRIGILAISNLNHEILISDDRSLNVWSLIDGIEKRKFVNLSSSKITALNIDKAERNVFIGNEEGFIL